MTDARGQAESLPARDHALAARVLDRRGRARAAPRAADQPARPGLRRGDRSTGTEALAEARRRPPDVVLLDLGLPDIDGGEVIRELRGWSRAPVIVLSGRSRLRRQDRRPGRGRRRLRHQAVRHGGTARPAAGRAAPRPPARQHQVQHRAYEIDIAAHTIVPANSGRPSAGAAGDSCISRPPSGGCWRSCSRLPGQLVGSDRLLGRVWGPGFERSTHYLRFHMAGLRRKLEDDPHRPRHLLTEPGMGYRFQP